MYHQLTQEEKEKLDNQSLEVLHLFRQGMGTIQFYYPKQYGSNKVYVKGAPVKPEYKGQTKIARGTRVMDWDKSEHFSLSKGEVSMIIGELSRILFNIHYIAKHPEIHALYFPLEFIHYPGDTSTEVVFDISSKPNSIFVLKFRVKDVKLAVGLSKQDAYELIESLRSIIGMMCEGAGQHSLYKKYTSGKKGDSYNNASLKHKVKDDPDDLFE